MARTKASVGAKISFGKSSKARCSAAPPPTTNAAGSSDRVARSSTSGGNPVCPRDTPNWQKPITNFFMCKDKTSDSDEESNDEAVASSSKSKPARNVIESDDDEEDPPTNQELDEPIELEPLQGEDSHKIEEYYPKNSKGKGVGKKTKNKENVDTNVSRNSKRDLEEITLGEETPVIKKIKVN